ncbi:MAG: hypothetical protein QM529_07175 [Hydrotalea sp.]|nr:hypothetical protein [Hydrotalea sp.]
MPIINHFATAFDAGDTQLIRFFIDNATGLSVSMLSLYFMFRLFDKHLTNLTAHLESLNDLVMILHNRGEGYQRDTTNALRRIEQKITRWPTNNLANNNFRQPKNQRKDANHHER